MKVCPNLLDALVVSGGASTSVAANPATNASGSESSQNSLAPFGHSRGPQLKKPSKILLKRREMSGAGGGNRTIRAYSFYVTYCKHTNARTVQPAVCPPPMYKIMYKKFEGRVSRRPLNAGLRSSPSRIQDSIRELPDGNVSRQVDAMRVGPAKDAELF